MALKVKSLFLIAHHALANQRVRELLLRRTDPRFLAAELAPMLFEGGDPQALAASLAKALEDHRQYLLEDRHPDAESRGRALVTFFNRVAQVNPRLLPAEIAGAVQELAEHGAYPGEAIFEERRFIARADQRPFAAIATIGGPHLSPLGRAVAGLLFVDPGSPEPRTARPVLVREQARLAVLPHSHAREFEAELIDAAERTPDLERKLPDLAALLEAVLGAEEIGAAITRGEEVWEARFAREDDVIRPAVKECLRSVAAKVVFERQEWFGRLFEEMEAR
jgi:hypothetical protein